jgi:TonB family protein
MNLARHYRLKFGAHRGDRAIFYLAIAVALHLGSIPLLLKAGLWQPTPSLSADPLLQPIEFVYLETPNASTPVATDRYSSVSALAGGVQNDKMPINSGKSGVGSRAIAPSEKSILPAPYPISSRAAASSLSNTSSKALDSSSARSSNHSLDHFSAPKTSPDPIPSVQHFSEPSSPQPEPADPRSSSDVPIASSSPSISSESLVQSLPDQDSEPLGSGLDGTLHSDGGDRNTASINASRDPVLGPYMATIQQRLYQNWQPINSPDRTRETVVRFVLDRQGELLTLEIVQPSGLAKVDQVALQAVSLAAPFAPLPPASTLDSLRITFTFTHRVQEPPL